MHWQPILTCSPMRAVRISSIAINSYQLLLYIYRLPKPVPDFSSSSFPVLGIRTTPTFRSLNQPTWQWHTCLSQAPPPRKQSLLKQPLAPHLVVLLRWRPRRSPRIKLEAFIDTKTSLCHDTGRAPFVSSTLSVNAI